MIRHGRNLAIYVNGVDISGDLNEINPVSEMDMAEVATFGAINHQSYAGLAKDSGTIQALYNSTEAAIFQNLVQASTGYGMMIAFTPTTAASSIYATKEIILKNNAMKSVVTDVNRATITFETQNRPFEKGTLLFPKNTNTTVGTVVDNLTSTLIGGAAYLQTFVCGSSGTATFTVQTSSTGAFAGEEATSAAFATVSSSGAPGTERVSISGTIERYAVVASNIALASTATFAIGLVRY